MNILLVDDDIHFLQDLRDKLNWSDYGYTGVLTAQSAQDAMQICKNVPVQTVLCDIEMPGTDGLALLSSLHEFAPELPCIVLTSYARFDYAQRAVALNITEYLLKPVETSALISALDKAKACLQKQKQSQQTQLLGEYWRDEQRNIAENFWRRAAAGAYSGLDATAEKLGYSAEEVFIPLLWELSGREALAKWDKPMLEYAVKNIGYEIFETSFTSPLCVISSGENRWLVVVKASRGPDCDTSPLIELLSDMKDKILEMAELTICFAIGNAVHYAKLSEEQAALFTLLDSTLDRAGKVLLCSQMQKKPSISNAAPEIKLWETLLQNNEKQALMRQIETFLRASAPTLTRSAMLNFRHDIAQMAYSFLKSNEIQTHRLFGDELSDELYRAAVCSVDDMLSYSRLLIERTLDYTNFSENPRGIIDTVLTYLDEHYTEDIQRRDLAEIVYVSPDYLSRLFKKETGTSVVQYIIDKRIAAACRLLKESSLPVNAVAMQVGFSSFAYFSKAFREATNQTPMAYRKQEKDK